MNFSSFRDFFSAPPLLGGLAGFVIAVAAILLVPDGVISSTLVLFGLLILASSLLFERGREKKVSVLLAGAQEQAAGILEQFPDALVVYDENRRILLFNRSAELLFNVSRSALLGKVVQLDLERTKPELGFFIKTFFPSRAPKVKKISISYPEVLEVEFSQPKPIALSITTMPFRSPQGKNIGFVKIIRDVTREHEISRMKSEFISIAAHQLRTPLSAIRWVFAMFESGDFGDISTRAQKAVRDGAISTEKLIKLVGDLLNVSRIEEERFGYKFVSGDLVRLLDKLVQDFVVSARERKVAIEFEQPDTSFPKLVFDAEKLSLALSNLIDNAVRYNKAGGRVWISVKKKTTSPFAEITIKDTGLGVPAGELQRIFSKFFRGSNVIKAETEGSGLGLFITRSVIEAHGGKVTFTSEEGRGTTVICTLPADPSLIPKGETIT